MRPEHPRRQEERVAADDWPARRDLHRRGFRLEGRLRAARVSGTGVIDELVYGRLAGDPEGPDAFTHVMNTVTPRKRLIAHALVTDAAGRLLLCETSFKQDFELPGGIVEPGESPREAVAREMVEELGWSPTVGGILVVDWLRPYKGWEDALELVFATATLDEPDAARLRADGHEILALHWLTPGELEAVMTPFGAARARSALAALAAGVTTYTEAGVPVD